MTHVLSDGVQGSQQEKGGGGEQGETRNQLGQIICTQDEGSVQYYNDFCYIQGCCSDISGGRMSAFSCLVSQATELCVKSSLGKYSHSLQ